MSARSADIHINVKPLHPMREGLAVFYTDYINE